MTKKILAVTFLSLVLSACESTGTDNTNANSNQKPNNQTVATPAPPASPTPAASPAAPAQLKAGDAVKVSLNGSVAEATVVSIDDKAGKVTVKLKSDGKAKTVLMSDIVK
jgi:sRNA-binding protein